MLLYLVGFAFSAQYVVLYAGSNTYYNYRHQADIFTIYNQLLARGFTKDNIALYAYDDIATDPENPFQEQIFHSIDHKINVYPGSSAINVKGDDVTAQAFYDAISYLPTTNEDYVFIYFDNHGFQGVLGTPDYKYIYADKLAQVFLDASQHNIYKKVLFVIEACYSGSVAQVIAKNTPNLAVITAANAKESSYAAIYDSQMGVYLSNEFTNYFIEVIDDIPSMTVGDLYTNLQNHTVQSHVCYFGDESMQDVPLSNFIGIPNKIISSKATNLDTNFVTPKESTTKTLTFLSEHSKPSIRARSRLRLLQMKYQREKLEATIEMLIKYVDKKNYEQIMNDKEFKPTDTYFHVLKVFIDRYGFINPDDFGLLNALVPLSALHKKTEIVEGIFAVIP